MPDNTSKTCKQIRNNQGLRETLCFVNAVNNACPQTCGSCCEDDNTYVEMRTRVHLPS